MAIAGRSAWVPLLVLLMAWLCVAASAAPQQGVASIGACPARLTTVQSASAPGGWQAERRAIAAPLEGIGFFDGPVADLVELAPEAETASGRGAIDSRWAFDPASTTIRLACTYRGTDMVLTRPIPRGTRSCMVRSFKATNRVDPTSLRCR